MSKLRKKKMQASMNENDFLIPQMPICHAEYAVTIGTTNFACHWIDSDQTNIRNMTNVRNTN